MWWTILAILAAAFAVCLFTAATSVIELVGLLFDTLDNET
jgi:hypothetical protein